MVIVTCIATLKGHSSTIWSVAFSVDGTQLASGSSDQTIKLLDIATGACTATLEGHSNSVWSVVFSADGTQLASGSADQTVKLWDTATGACTATLEGNRYISHLTFDPTDSLLYTNFGTFALNTLLVHNTSAIQLAATPTAIPAAIAMPGTSAHHIECRGAGLDKDSTWITWNSERILWLPPAYRPGPSAVLASTVAIGCRSGRVIIITISPDHLSK